MAHQRDYYQILQVSSNADVAIIKSAYYTHLKTLKKHPDLGGSHEEAMLLNEAYEILSDPLKRKAYDKNYSKGKTPYPPEKEKRRVVRIPFKQNLRFRRKNELEWVQGQFRDISNLGACFRSLEAFKKGEILELDAKRANLHNKTAKVRWVRSIPQRFGELLYEGGVEFEK